MSTYNDIRIGSKLDWQRIGKLFRMEVVAGIMVLVRDIWMFGGLLLTTRLAKKER